MVQDTIGGGSITVSGWYDNNASKLDIIITDDSALDVSMIDQLVQAMSVFDIDYAGDGVVSQNTQTQLDQVMAESWQVS